MRARVVTYNIHKCIGGLDRRYDPERVTETIGHYAPDVVLLQEVAQGSRRFRGERQVERLGEALGLRHRSYFVNVRKRAGRGEYGNAVLSRFPISRTENVDVTIPPKKRRSVLHAHLRLRVAPGRTRTLHVFNLHLGLLGIERRMQLRRFLDSHPFAGLHPRTPVLVGGDFNDVWGTLGQLLLPAGFRGMPAPIETFPALMPVRALDSLYLRGQARLLRIFRSRLRVARHASDHLPLIADLEITPARGRRR